MALPTIGTHPRYVEELRVGGGYGSAPDGGADVDRAGNAAFDGDVTVGGALEAGGPVSGSAPWSLTVGGNTPLQIRRNAGAAFSQIIVPLSLKNSAGDYVSYGEIVVKIQANTAGGEDGLLQLGIRKSGAMVQVLTLSPAGIQLTGLPTSAPGGSGWLWNNGGDLRIT